MRLLPIGSDHGRDGSACLQPSSQRCRYRHCDGRKHLSLRNLSSHSRSHQTRGGEVMSALEIVRSTPATRRVFLQSAGGLVLGFVLPSHAAEKRNEKPPEAAVGEATKN